MSTSKKFKQHWKKHYKDLEYYPHPEIHCQCPCQGKIPVMSYHSWYGIPQYIKGHNNPTYFRRGKPARNRNKPHTAKTIQKMKASASRRKPSSDLTKELQRLGCGTLERYPGPDWYLSFRDFVLHAVYIYNIQYMRASIHIRKELSKKDLVRFDITLATNFWIGHNIIELAEKYEIDIDEVAKRLKTFEEEFPGSFQTQISAPALPNSRWVLEWVNWAEVICKF